MDRNGLIQHTRNWIARLGTQSDVARKIGISDAALSTWLGGKYGADTEKMDRTIAKALDYKPKSWVTVQSIVNYRMIEVIVADARKDHQWFAISNKAGSGKTETLEDIYNRDVTGSVLLIQAEEWHARQFLMKLVERLCGPICGKSGTKRMGGGVRQYYNVADLIDIVVSHISNLDNPVLMIDEADKLRPSALRTLIPIYNRTRGRLGVVLAGTENLEKEIKSGVRSNRKGYDELDSRLCRTYIKLQGATQREVFAICEANGINEQGLQGQQARVMMENIWNNLDKVKKPIGKNQTLTLVAEDFRKIERLIYKEKVLNAIEK
jgi:DNA transposition AAA+ family ATPase